MMRDKVTQYCGCVKNKRFRDYDFLFTTEISAPLAEARAREKAEGYNKQCDEDYYDLNDIKVMQRTVTMTYGQWKEV